MGFAAEDITGMTFGRLTAIARDGSAYPVRWFFKCACGGTVRSYRTGHVKSGVIKSCGCLRREVGLRTKTHGMSKTGIYKTWESGKRRCHDPGHKQYQSYGGRGIIMCEKWRDSFESFLSDMGPQPSPKHSLDRINNDGNYEPEKCQWADSIQQANNRRTNVNLTFNQETRTVSQWAHILKINTTTIHNRLKLGLPPGQVYVGNLQHRTTLFGKSKV